jgi:hypothetical protein
MNENRNLKRVLNEEQDGDGKTEGSSKRLKIGFSPTKYLNFRSTIKSMKSEWELLDRDRQICFSCQLKKQYSSMMRITRCAGSKKVGIKHCCSSKTTIW